MTRNLQFCDARSMANAPVLARTATLVAAAGSVFGAAATVAGAVLARSYRPHAPGVDTALLPADVRAVDRWSDVHLYMSMLVLVAAVAALVLTWLVRRRGGSTIAVVVSGVGAAAAGLAIWTRPLVRWDQLALEAVTVGTNVSGYWYAAFDHGVRFVLVGPNEVTQRDYAPVLIAHLAAPAVAAIALGVVCVVNVRQHARRVRSAHVPVEPVP
jgi:hypothetical protein